MREPLPTAKKIFDLEGEAQLNSDGVSRQEELWRCVPGELVHLRLDGRDATSPPEVVVLSSRGVPIGRLTRHYAALLAPLLDSRRPHRAKLHCLRGGLAGYPLYGARISIAWDDRPEHPHRALDQEQMRYRARRAARGSFRGSDAAVDLANWPRPVLVVADRDAARIALLIAIAAAALLVVLLVQRVASTLVLGLRLRACPIP